MKNYPGTMFVLAVCTAVMAVASVLPGAAHVLAFRPDDGVYGWLGLLTHMFDHGGWDHLVGNMTFGLPFMAYLEHRVGRARFLKTFLLCGLGGALLNLTLMGPVAMLGASGAIFGCAVAACMAFGETAAEHLTAVGMLLALMVPQLQMAPLSAMFGVAFYAHIGGGLTALVLASRGER